jgi:hypothetical protein
MTVDEFLVWAEAQDGRWELYNGVPYAMAPERARHGEVKFAGFLSEAERKRATRWRKTAMNAAHDAMGEGIDNLPLFGRR